MDAEHPFEGNFDLDQNPSGNIPFDDERLGVYEDGNGNVTIFDQWAFGWGMSYYESEQIARTGRTWEETIGDAQDPFEYIDGTGEDEVFSAAPEQNFQVVYNLDENGSTSITIGQIQEYTGYYNAFTNRFTLGSPYADLITSHKYVYDAGVGFEEGDHRTYAGTYEETYGVDAGDGAGSPGESILYTISLDNPGDATLEEYTISDPIDGLDEYGTVVPDSLEVVSVPSYKYFDYRDNSFDYDGDDYSDMLPNLPYPMDTDPNGPYFPTVYSICTDIADEGIGEACQDVPTTDQGNGIYYTNNDPTFTNGIDLTFNGIPATTTYLIQFEVVVHDDYNGLTDNQIINEAEICRPDETECEPIEPPVIEYATIDLEAEKSSVQVPGFGNDNDKMGTNEKWAYTISTLNDADDTNDPGDGSDINLDGEVDGTARASAKDVTISDDLPAGLTYVDADGITVTSSTRGVLTEGTDYTLTNGFETDTDGDEQPNLELTVDTIAPDEQIDVTFNVLVDEYVLKSDVDNGVEFVNTATISPGTGNVCLDADGVTIITCEDLTPERRVGKEVPVIEAEKRVTDAGGDGGAGSGEVLTYSIDVTNNSSLPGPELVPAYDVRVIDTLSLAPELDKTTITSRN